MRDIKFRGKRIDNGEWVYGYYGTNGSGKEWIICPIVLTEVHSFQYFEIISGTGNQFTGLHDKNNNPIYEGDSVEYERYDSWSGEWLEEGGIVGYDNGEFFPVPNNDNIKEFQITGNIYESPLIK